MQQHKKDIIILKTNKFNASSFFLGRTIDNSKLPVDTGSKTRIMLMYNPKTAISFGEYNLVIMGLIAIGSNCAIIVPAIRVNVCLVNSFFGNNRFNEE